MVGGWRAGAVTVNIGAFITLVLNFVIVAFALFMVIKAMNSARRTEPAVEVAPPPSKEVILLSEIRDLLKARVCPRLRLSVSGMLAATAGHSAKPQAEGAVDL